MKIGAAQSSAKLPTPETTICKILLRVTQYIEQYDNFAPIEIIEHEI